MNLSIIVFRMVPYEDSLFANKDYLASFPLCVPFSFISCLMALPETSYAVSNENCESVPARAVLCWNSVKLAVNLS